MGTYVGQRRVLIKSIKGSGGPTCRARGFQRMFFSMAGVELSVLWGRFFRVRDTTPLSARSEPTRLRNCQPTCRRENVIMAIIWAASSTEACLLFLFTQPELRPRRDWIWRVEAAERAVAVAVLSLELPCDVTCPPFQSNRVLSLLFLRF